MTLVSQFIPSPNYKKGRGGKAITAIVIHYTASMTLESPVSWFQNPASNVSAHYVIGRDGKIVQMVRDEDTAWHAGRSAMKWSPDRKTAVAEPNVNPFSLGIELVGTQDSGFTDKQLASLYQLLEHLVVRYKVQPDRVVGHCHVSPGRKIDPDGTHQQFNWTKTWQVCQTAYAALGRPA